MIGETPKLDIREIAGDREIPADVLEEWEKYQEFEGQSSGPYLHNFHCRFREGLNRRVRINYVKDGRLSPDRLEVMLNEKPDPNEECPSSGFRASQTLREFEQIIDDLMDRLGLTRRYLELVAECDTVNLNRREVMRGNDKDVKARIRFESSRVHKQIDAVIGMPMYWHMRIMGYKRYPDLIR